MIDETDDARIRVKRKRKNKGRQKQGTRKTRVPRTALHLSLDCISWLEDYHAVTTHLGMHGNLQERARRHGGLLRIKNFLPKSIAAFCYETLRAIPDGTWIQTAAEEDARKNNINHCFYSCKTGTPHLDLILRVFGAIVPEDLSVFSAAKYVGEHGHCIERHDDRAYVPVKMEDTGNIVQCCRKMALVYYLGNGPKEPWDGEMMGGMFVDCEDTSSPQERREYAPEFNTLVVFEIPRYHIVTPVLAPHTRYSVFGWTLEPGTSLYSLGDG